MAIDAAMALTNRLLANAQALAAVTASLRAQAEGVPLDPDLQRAIEGVLDALECRDALDALSPQERSVVIAFARSYLRQALELVDEPFRPSAWSHTDPTILQAQGSASGVVARLIAASGLGAPGMRVLDIGTGVAGLAIAFCRTFPDATVVGVDPWEPSLALARANLVEAGLEHRVTLHAATIEEFSDPDGFDLAWLPSFFLPPRVLPSALRRVGGLLRPGGRLVVGVMEGPEDPVGAAVDTMITIRSGGAVLSPAGARDLMVEAALVEVKEVTRTWQAPLRLVTGQRPAASG